MGPPSGKSQNNSDSSGDDEKIAKLESRIDSLEQMISGNAGGGESSGNLSDMAPNTIMGNNTGSAAEPSDLTKSQIVQMLKGTDENSLMVGNDDRVVKKNHGVYRMKGKYFVPTPTLPEPQFEEQLPLPLR